MPPHSLHDGRLADTHTQQEPTVEGLREGELCSHHRRGVAGPDGGDPGRHHHPACGTEEQRRVHEDFAAQAFRDPQRGEAQVLQLLDDVTDHRRR